MIQDIFPHVYHNEFTPHAPKAQDIVLIFDGNEVLLDEKNKWMLTFEEVKARIGEQEAEYRYLFQIDDTGFFYLRNVDVDKIPGLCRCRKNIFRTYAPRHLAFAGITAFNLYQWRESHQFCGRCGGQLEPDEKERAMRCPKCGEIVYPVISPAVIIGLIDPERDRILFTKYADRDYKKYALIAGFSEIGETLEQTVAREVKEEVGLSVKNIRYYKNQPWAFTGTLLVGFFAELDGADDITLEEDELGEATWFTRENMPPTDNDISLTAEMMEVFRRGEEKQER